MCALSGGVRAEAPARAFLAYHASWYERRAPEAEATSLARLPTYFTHVALAFARPDLSYPVALDLAGTGLQYPYDGTLLKQAIARLKARAPGMRVLISVGGANYKGWDRLDVPALARLVRDLGADGVDIDYEPAAPSCAAQAGRIRCASDEASINIVRRIRAALPRPLMVTAALWSVGAYGEGAFADAPPRSPWTGSALAMLRSPAADDLDLVTIMSYDAGPAFRPEQAFRAYRAVWRGPLSIGIRVLPGGPDEPRFTLESTARLLRAVKDDPTAGAMLYALGERPEGPAGPDNPDDRSLAVAACVTLGLQDCSEPFR